MTGVWGPSSAFLTGVEGPNSPYLTNVRGPSSAYLTRVGGLREVKIKYIFVYFTYYLPLLENLSPGGRYLDLNASSDKVLSKSNIPL